MEVAGLYQYFGCTIKEAKYKLRTKQRQLSYTQTYLELGQTFEKVANGFMSLTIYTKSSILDVWPSTKYASDIPPVDNKKSNFANNFVSYIWNTFS